MKEVIERLKKETNNLESIIYRKKKIDKKEIYIIYDETLISSNKISDFVVRSLNIVTNSSNLINDIKNNISNFKVKEIFTYQEIVDNLHNGFTIILINDKEYLALETKTTEFRSIEFPNAEKTNRGAKDSFIENYETNISLIKRRIKTNNLWVDSINVGKYTKTKISVLHLNKVADKELVEKVIVKLNDINIDGITESGLVKNLIEDETKSIFPTIKTTERPDITANCLLEGKIVIIVDNSPYALIIPGLFVDFFKTPEDIYSKSINTSFTRILRYVAFFIALAFPGIYISLINYNQEMIPTELLISFAIQRSGVPFPAFVEAFIMIFAFELLRESDLRVPGFTGSALSIVGALILGEAAVSAGIVSPIMIIVIATTAIASLPFTEPELINSIKWYRLLFMIGASFLGIIGVVAIFIYLLVKLNSLDSFGIPYLEPFTPTKVEGLKDSIIKLPLKKLKNSDRYIKDGGK